MTNKRFIGILMILFLFNLAAFASAPASDGKYPALCYPASDSHSTWGGVSGGSAFNITGTSVTQTADGKFRVLVTIRSCAECSNVDECGGFKELFNLGDYPWPNGVYVPQCVGNLSQCPLTNSCSTGSYNFNNLVASQIDRSNPTADSGCAYGKSWKFTLSYTFNELNEDKIISYLGWDLFGTEHDHQYYFPHNLQNTYVILPRQTPVCIPSCIGKQCGSDGCGGICGTCSDGKTCSSQGTCNPVPTPICSKDSDCGTNTLSGNSCSGNNVIKSFTNFTCSNKGTASSSCSNVSGVIPVQTCSASQLCSLGTCQDVACFSDSDCPSPFYSTISCVGNNLTRTKTISNCQKAGTLASQCISSEHLDVIQTCQYGCSNNACNPSPHCSTDSECGQPGSHLDCSGDNVVNVTNTPKCSQSVCTNDNSSEIVKNCPYGCYNGMCKNDLTSPVVNLLYPLNSSTLNFAHIKFIFNVSDNSAISSCSLNVSGSVTGNSSVISKSVSNTISVSLVNGDYSAFVSCTDEFGNKGTSNTVQFKVNVSQTNVCSCAADCGDDGYVGEKFCSSGDVYGDYRMYACMNGVCSSSTNEKKVESCDEGCDSGECNLHGLQYWVGDTSRTKTYTVNDTRISLGSAVQKITHGTTGNVLNLTSDNAKTSVNLFGGVWIWVLVLVFLLLILILLILIARASMR